MKLSIFSTSPTNQAFSALLIADENVNKWNKRLHFIKTHKRTYSSNRYGMHK